MAKTTTPKETNFEVLQADLVSCFKAIGYETAGEWSLPKWQEKLAAFPKRLKTHPIENEDELPRDVRLFLDELLDALENGQVIEIVPTNGESVKVETNGEAKNNEAPAPKLKAQKTFIVPLNKLKNAKYNPDHRTEANASLKAFAKQLKEDGQVHSPIFVYPEDENNSDTDYHIIEGHRRAEASRMNGWESIECILKSKEDADAIYASMNSTAKKHSGTDTLSVFLKNKEAVPEKLAKKMSEVTDLVGRDMMKKLANNKLSVRTVKTAQKIVAWLGTEAESDKYADQVGKTLEWMLKGYTGLAMRLLAWSPDIDETLDEEAQKKSIVEQMEKAKKALSRAIATGSKLKFAM